MTGGFETKWQVEIDPYANKVLEKHWPNVTRWDDVKTFPPPVASPWLTHKWGEKWNVDVIIGGFPCQDISFAGKGAGLKGARSGLWFEYARIIGTLRPRFVIVENVAALLARGIGDVLGTLASLGYDAEWHCVPAAYVGAPHIRDRVWIIANANNSGIGTSRGGTNKNVETKDSRKQKPQPKPCRCNEPMHSKCDCQKCNGVCERLIVPDSSFGRHRTQEGEVQSGRSGSECCDWWEVEPCVRRVDDGSRGRVHRLRCLGNAVVPQVAELIGNRLLQSIEHGDQPK